jgi:hypothetical protein
MAQGSRLRPYRPSGLYPVDPPAAALEAAAVALRNELIADLGGPEIISTAQKLLVTSP